MLDLVELASNVGRSLEIVPDMGIGAAHSEIAIGQLEEEGC